MKPEAPARAVELTEDEKLVLNLLKVNSPMNRNALKDQTGLSNKKWDKAIKGLTTTQTGQGGEDCRRVVGFGGIKIKSS
jgi:lysyl-tRNA synthetase class 2